MLHQNPPDKAVSRPAALLLGLLAFAGTGAAQTPAEVYHEHCVVCHGEKGDGQSRVRDSLDPPPRDFTSPEARAQLSRERMIRSVTEGRPGTAMVAFGAKLSSETIAGLVDHIRETFMTPLDKGLGQRLYVKHCAACHGDDGATAVWARNGLNPPPRNFTTPAARAELSRERMLVSVAHGRPGTAMMPFQNRLVDREIQAVVDYIRAEFMEGEGRRDAAQPATPAEAPMPDGLVGDFEKGRAFYMDNCYTCHGKKGDGQGPRAHFNRPPPRDFTSAESRRLFDRPRLFHAITEGKRGTVMPAWGKVLTPQQIADVAEFVYRAFIRESQDLAPVDFKAFEPTTAGPGSVSVERGRKVYNYRCYFCHGYNGDGNTVASLYLDPRPRDFTRSDPKELTRREMIEAVAHGSSGSAMKGFEGVLNRDEIEAVVDFVRQTFMHSPRFNTRYHTSENGWVNHDRYAAAFPFALGEISLDRPLAALSEEEREGRTLFLSSCITCHESRSTSDEEPVWDARPLSFPRNGYSHTRPDAVSSASIYASHDQAPRLDDLTPVEWQGQVLFQQNCAFCHAADGTGRNWIGSFIEPHPRNFTEPLAMQGMTREQLRKAIKEGVPGTAMPAWKSVLQEDQIEAVIAYIVRAFDTALN